MLDKTQLSEFLSDLRRTVGLVPNAMFTRSAHGMLTAGLYRLLQENAENLEAVHPLIEVKPLPTGVVVRLSIPADYVAAREVQLAISEQLEADNQSLTRDGKILIVMARGGIPAEEQLFE